jgi:cytochrome P450
MEATMASPQSINLTDVQPFVDGAERELFKILRRDEPLHWSPEADGPGFWSITRYGDAVRILSDHARFINGQGTQLISRRIEGETSTVHNSDPPRHSQLRKLAAPHLRAMKVRDWQEVIDLAVADLLDSVTAINGEVELVHSLSAILPIRVLGRVLGVPAEDCWKLMDWTNRLVSDDPEYAVAPNEREKARAELFGYFRELTELRRLEPKDDLVSKLVQAELDGAPVEWDDLAAYYFVLVAAGNETTRNLITGSVLAFDEFPDQFTLLNKNRDLLPLAVEELIRYVTPVRAMRRTATESIELHGKTISPGEKVVVWFESANRDERAFNNPDLLDIRRQDETQHVGFGWGIHACMGSHLARAEAYSLYRQILDRGMRITPTGAPERLHSNHFNGIKRLRTTIKTGQY